MCMEISQEFDTMKIISEMVRNLLRLCTITSILGEQE